jgi:hypothetical protein
MDPTKSAVGGVHAPLVAGLTGVFAEVKPVTEIAALVIKLSANGWSCPVLVFVATRP